MIIITVHGEYYFKTENLKGRRPFEQTVKAPSLNFFTQISHRYIGSDEKTNEPKFKTTEFQNVRGILKKKLLPLLLKTRFQDFIRVRSVIIDSITSPDGSTLDLPVNLRSRDQLISLCKEKRLPIEAASYLDIDELRTDILEYQDDPATFLLNQERKNKKRVEEKEFMELNGLTENIKISPIPVEVPVKPDDRPITTAQVVQGAGTVAAAAGGIADL